ncbi:hypothetical protein NDU88_005841 [Pleurodeles waltl]|uniref:Uncharacterized protein n=1 Tax=Pleurodeles waltl TaxID=8319 RepID=A0AAV7TDU0_PLEWA|nr:hypothetical protein NDU88_005841 [Pleurodeles waltl]
MQTIEDAGPEGGERTCGTEGAGSDRDEETQQKEDTGTKQEEGMHRKEDAGPQTKTTEESAQGEPEDRGGWLCVDAWGANEGRNPARKPCHVPGGTWLNWVQFVWYRTVSHIKMGEEGEKPMGENISYV